MSRSSNSVDTTKPALKHSNLFLTIGVSSFVLFVLLTIAILTTEWLPRLDGRLLDFFARFREQAPAWLTTFSTWYQNTSSAGLGIVSALLILYFLLSGRTRRFFLMLAGVGGIELLWFVLMFAIGRERPEEVIIWGGLNLPSYPSGHAMFNVAFYGALLYIFYFQIQSKQWRRLFIGVVVSLLLLTGVNRLFFSVHYFSDVIGGYLIGIDWTTLALWSVEWFLTRKKSPSEEALQVE